MTSNDPSSPRPDRSGFRRIGAAYLVLLAVSHLVWALGDAGPARSIADRTLELPAFDAEGRVEGEVEVAYLDRPSPTELVPLVLLHGSPGSSSEFRGIVDALPTNRRVIAPDLPGFGASEMDVPDYSVAAHARYTLALLDELGVASAHLIGFSMGGGVAIEMVELAPERVASVSLVSAIGVQELELFGDHDLNHALHGVQLFFLRIAPFVLPHFGAMDGRFFGVPYGRNFYDTDQRPIREALERMRAPMLVVHGERDFLVPPEAAREHHRIVPHSRLEMLDESHFFVFTDPGPAARLLADFANEVDRGEAPTRDTADPARVALAEQPFDPAVIPPFAGPALLVALLLIALLTFVSEDLTCIGAGLLVAQGRLSLLAATTACFVGIFVGDVLLYLGGRFLGRPALSRAPLSWFVSEASVERAAGWFEERGGRVIFLSRFVPGTRLPTYVAAGMLGQSLLVFSLWFILAGLLWTPLFVGFASWAGTEAAETFDLFERWALPGAVGLALVLLALQRVVVPMFSHRGRRLLVGRYLRIRRWEFWPVWIFYVPIVVRIAWLALRHRSLSVMTAVNPGIDMGGFVGESKIDILHSLDPELIASFVELPAKLSAAERRERAREFHGQHGLPLVLKPDVGERGSGVRILRDAEALDAALDGLTEESILQEHVEGLEVGIFYVRRPSDEEGRIFSITEKRLPSVVGDGVRSLEELILDDPRAVAATSAYFEANAGRLTTVPAAGESVQLVDLGTHCRGAIFLDGGRLATPELARAVERLARSFDGFYFGRFDAIAASEEALRRGELRVIELNGLTSEATHVYDPRISLLEAYRVLFEQWSLAFEIGAENAARGTRPTPFLDVLRRIGAHRRRQGSRSAS